ncbi:MAG: alpha/beta hydrolase [Terriglobales bacterium]|jgi:pimeloyl-ACP methyl ester carboxylesterase
MVGIAMVVVLGIVVMVGSVWKSDLPVDALKPRWAQPPSQFVTLDGMQVHVRDEGRRDDPIPIVLLHGTGSSLQTWDGWASQLKATHRVIRFDRPGFGLTGPNSSGDYSMDYYSGFLGRLLDQLGVNGPVILVGNSSGGQMAWLFSVAHPGRVARLVLISPAGYPRSVPLPQGLQMAMNPKMDFITRHILPKSQVRKGAEISYGDPSKLTDETVDRYYDLTRREGNRKALGQTLRASIGHEDTASINQVKVQTLILWGSNDTMIPASPDAEQFHQRIAGSKLVILPGDGHVAQEEDPDGTLAAFNQWLTSAAK